MHLLTAPLANVELPDSHHSEATDVLNQADIMDEVKTNPTQPLLVEQPVLVEAPEEERKAQEQEEEKKEETSDLAEPTTVKSDEASFPLSNSVKQSCEYIEELYQ